MATSVNPVNNNDGYKQFQNLGIYSTDVHSSSAIITDLFRASKTKVGNYYYTTINAYAPSQFATSAAGSFTLVKTSGATQATALTDASVVNLPAGAEVTNIVATNNGVTIVGGTSFNIGFGAAINTTPVTLLLNTALTATINGALGAGAGTGAGGVTQAAGAALGGAGVSLATAVSPTVTVGAAASPLSVGITGTNTAGSLQVEITYRVAAN